MRRGRGPTKAASGKHRARKEFPLKVSIVGTGIVGSTLGALLFEKGNEIVSLVNRTAKSARALGRTVQCHRVSTSLGDISPETEILLITVSDDALPEIAQEVARKSKLGNILVAHTSGVHSVDILKPFQSRGNVVGALHPIQSFPATKSLRDRTKSVHGSYFGVEGEKKALGIIEKIVRRLGGKTIAIPRGLKPLYHAACVFGSNYLVTLFNAVDELSLPLKFNRRWREIVFPLAASTLENVLTISPREALTGPVVRNDVHTVALHLTALRKFAPQLVPLYSVLAIETARLARESGKLNSQQFRAFVKVIRQHVQTHLTDGSREKEND